MTTTQINDSSPASSESMWFDIGDVVHSIAQFWAKNRRTQIAVKSPMGLRSTEDEARVRLEISRSIANASRSGASLCVVVSELDGQIRVSVQTGTRSDLITLGMLWTRS